MSCWFSSAGERLLSSLFLNPLRKRAREPELTGSRLLPRISAEILSGYLSVFVSHLSPPASCFHRGFHQFSRRLPQMRCVQKLFISWTWVHLWLAEVLRKVSQSFATI